MCSYTLFMAVFFPASIFAYQIEIQQAFTCKDQFVCALNPNLIFILILLSFYSFSSILAYRAIKSYLFY